MPQVLKDLFGSKKFLASCAGILCSVILMIAGKYHLGIDEQQAEKLAQYAVGLVVTYIGSQGLADHGKEAASITAEAKPADKPQG